MNILRIISRKHRKIIKKQQIPELTQDDMPVLRTKAPSQSGCFETSFLQVLLAFVLK